MSGEAGRHPSSSSPLPRGAESDARNCAARFVVDHTLSTPRVALPWGLARESGPLTSRCGEARKPARPGIAPERWELSVFLFLSPWRYLCAWCVIMGDPRRNSAWMKGLKPGH